MGRLSGKTALVTGAARGIGQSIAVTLARQGADVAICDVQRAWLDETEQAVTTEGRRALACAADVTQADQVAEAVKQVIEGFGRIDILVNNAGITRDTFLVRMSDEDWDAVLNVNLRGTFLFTRAVTKPMMRARTGAIVNIASIIGVMGNAGQANYAASKAGVIALTRSTAKELASRNIRANAVAPGFIQTRMTDALTPDVREKMLAAIPLGRFGTPQDVADVVAFLASDEAAFVTGQVINICGGMVTA